MADDTESMDVDGGSTHPQISQRMELLCGKCVTERSPNSKRSACHHTPTCPAFDVILNAPEHRPERPVNASASDSA
jgi:hypothetical protein